MSKKKPITDEERADLVQQLMDDLEDFVAERSIQSRQNKDGATEDDKSIDEIADVSTTVLCVFICFYLLATAFVSSFRFSHSFLLVWHTEKVSHDV